MKVTILMDNFPMDYLDLLKRELGKFELPAEVNILGRDVVATATLNDSVKVQLFAICCDKFRFGGGDDDNLSDSG